MEDYFLLPFKTVSYPQFNSQRCPIQSLTSETLQYLKQKPSKKVFYQIHKLRYLTFNDAYSYIKHFNCANFDQVPSYSNLVLPFSTTCKGKFFFKCLVSAMDSRH